MSDDDQMRSSRTPDGEPATPVHELTTSEGSSPTSSAPQDRSDAGTPAPDPPARRRRVTVPMAARRPRGTLGAAVVALGALVGVATLVTPTVTAAQTQPRPEAVASTELVCPVTTASSALTSTVSAGVATLPTVSTGLATLADLATQASATRPPKVIREPGQTVTTVITGRTGPALLARATGSFAQGFGADQTIRSGQGATRGLAAAPCTRPVTDAWLVGGGSTVGRVSQVLLVNDDDRAAQVDLLVYGARGQISNPAGQGIVLPPGSRRQVRLDAVAPNQKYLAVHVIARTGRIGVLGLDQEAVGLVPLGLSLVPATDEGTRLVVPAVPAPVQYALLTVLSPDVDTTVDIRLLTPDGSVVPTDISTITLPAGHLTAVRIDAALAGVPSGLLLTSDVPVVAGVEVGTGGPTVLREHDATAPVPALTAPGIVVGLAGGAVHQSVMLAAPATASSVRVELFAPGSTTPRWGRTVQIAGGSLAQVTIPVATATASSMLVITPLGGGPVYASRQVSEAGAHGPMTALAPIYPQRASTLVPTVVSQPGSSVTGVSRR